MLPDKAKNRPRESLLLRSSPEVCISTCLNLRKSVYRSPVAEARLRRSLAHWWARIPASRRTYRTDCLAARVLAESFDPAALAEYWAVTGDPYPWASSARMLDGLTTLARVLAENPGLAEALRVLDDLSDP